ncbi:MAG: restriction endonuclease subunit S [Anaerolineales bacterium]|jgi:type I restriction enzyme S subunit
MEVRPGYKNTDLGVIPIDWDVKHLGDVGEALIGLTYKPTNVHSDGVLVLRSSNIQGGILVFDDNVFVRMDIPEKCMVKKGDILICVRNGSRDLIGKCAYIDDRALGMAFGAFMTVYRSTYHPFIFHQFQSRVIKRQIHEHLGATINQITNKSLNSFRIPLPPKVTEQTAIAEALTDADLFIESLEQLLTKKRQIKQGAMQELLTGNNRLSGFKGQWDKKQLGNVFNISAGKSKSSYIVNGGQYWIVDMGSVSREGKLIVSKGTNFHRDFLNRGDLVMPKDDIGGGNIIGKVGYINTDGTYVLGDHVYRLEANGGNSLFLSFLINSYRVNNELRRKVIGTAQLGLGRKSVEEQEIPFPLPAEQDAIAEILSDMDYEITVLEDKLTKARQIKQGMMQELLTGRRRLI